MESQLRRVPWVHRATEFAECFRLLFTADGNQQQAVDMIRMWMARGGCPPAIESTASLLDVLFLEQPLAQGQLSSLVLRQSYATAIVRFVNGLVDPLQQSFAARSIGHIAAQIGLPQYFVDLRHAATHEDLPRLEVLRRSAKEALGWLYARYWLPSMDYEQHSAASANGDSTTLATQEDFPALIMEQMVYYKDTSKKGLRDVSTAKPKELRRVCACIERLAESATNASSAGNSSSEAVRVYDWVVDALLVPGSLVPKSKKKRVGVHNKRLSAEGVDTWLPLVDYFAAQMPGFVPALLKKLIEATKSTGSSPKRDEGYVETIHFWLETLFERLKRREPGLYKQCLQWSLLTRSQRSLEFAEHLIAVESGSKTEDPETVRIQMLIDHAKKSLQPIGLFAPRIESEEAASRLANLEARQQAPGVPLEGSPPSPSSTGMDVDEDGPAAAPSPQTKIQRYGKWTEVTLKQSVCIGALSLGAETPGVSLLLR